MYLPFSLMLERMPTTATSSPSLVNGREDGPWISPKLCEKRRTPSSSNCCSGKRSTPYCPRAPRIRPKSSSETGADTSNPRIVAPRIAPLGSITSIISLRRPRFYALSSSRSNSTGEAPHHVDGAGGDSRDDRGVDRVRPTILGQMKQAIASDQRHKSTARAMDIACLTTGLERRGSDRIGSLPECGQCLTHCFAQQWIRGLNRQLSPGGANVGSVMNPDGAIRSVPAGSPLQKRVQPQMPQFVPAVRRHDDIARRTRGDQRA